MLIFVYIYFTNILKIISEIKMFEDWNEEQKCSICQMSSYSRRDVKILYSRCGHIMYFIRRTTKIKGVQYAETVVLRVKNQKR